MEERLDTRRRRRPTPAFHLAQSSLKKIHAVIRAYYVIGRSATLDEVQRESQLSQGTVANLQRYLTDMGILMGSPRRKQLRPLGLELGKAIKSRKSDASINRVWRRIVCQNGFCVQVLQQARLEGKLDRNRFVYLVFTAAGYRPRDLSHDYTTGGKALISIFKRAGFVRRSNGYFTVGRSLEKLLEKQRSELAREADYISQDRLSELEQLQADRRTELDLSRLITCCHQLNDNYRAGNTLSVTILCSAILDHVAPIFGQPDFASVEAHAGTADLKEAARSLSALRTLASRPARKKSADAADPSGPPEQDFRPSMNFIIARVIERLAASGEPDRSIPEVEPAAGPQPAA